MCDEPKKFSVDTTAMTDALKGLANSTVYNGGLTDQKSQEDFERVVRLQTKSADMMYGVVSRLADGDVSSLRKSLNLEHIQDDLLARVYKGILESPLTVKITIVFGVFLIVVIMFLFCTCRRCAAVRDARHTDERERRMSKLNYWWALASPSQVTVNLNKRLIEKIHDKNDDLMTKILELETRIDSILELKQESSAPPPAYPNLLD